jgi:hypothetical protein
MSAFMGAFILDEFVKSHHFDQIREKPSVTGKTGS